MAHMLGHVCIELGVSTDDEEVEIGDGAEGLVLNRFAPSIATYAQPLLNDAEPGGASRTIAPRPTSLGTRSFPAIRLP